MALFARLVGALTSHLTLHELVEAACRSGQTTVATRAFEQLSATTTPGGTAWALGVEARCRAMLNAGDAAEALYLEAIDQLERSPLRPEAAAWDQLAQPA